MVTLIQSPEVPAPRGHYSHAVVHRGTVYVSGLLPITQRGEVSPAAPFEQQVEAVLDNLEHILRASGSRLDHVIRSTCYIADIALWTQFNELYGARFREHRPARTVVPVPRLHDGYLIEMDAIAAVV